MSARNTPIADQILHYLGGAEFLVASNAYKFEFLNDPPGLSFRQHTIFKSARNPEAIGRICVTRPSIAGYTLSLMKRRNRWAPWEDHLVIDGVAACNLRYFYAAHACTTLL
jgi:hypothetical protein